MRTSWQPVGKEVPIVVDPRNASGVPTIQGRGVTIRGIVERFKNQQSIRLISDDLNISSKKWLRRRWPFWPVSRPRGKPRSPMPRPMAAFRCPVTRSAWLANESEVSRYYGS